MLTTAQRWQSRGIFAWAAASSFSTTLGREIKTVPQYRFVHGVWRFWQFFFVLWLCNG